METIGDRIKIVRTSKGLSQVDFAKALGIHRGHVSRIETGSAKASDELLMSICIDFKISYKWLVNGIGGMEKDWFGLSDLTESEDDEDIEIISASKFKEASALLEILDTLVKRYQKVFDCLTPDIHILEDPSVKPGDPIVIKVVKRILHNLENTLSNDFDSRRDDNSLKLVSKNEVSTINIMREIDDENLKDFYLFLSSKGKSLEPQKRKRVDKDIARLTKAVTVDPLKK